MKQESLETIGLKAAPAVGYLGATFAGLSLPDWAALLACVYTLLLIGQMIFRFIRFFRERRLAKIAGDAKDYGADGP